MGGKFWRSGAAGSPKVGRVGERGAAPPPPPPPRQCEKSPGRASHDATSAAMYVLHTYVTYIQYEGGAPLDGGGQKGAVGPHTGPTGCQGGGPRRAGRPAKAPPVDRQRPGCKIPPRLGSWPTSGGRRPHWPLAVSRKGGDCIVAILKQCSPLRSCEDWRAQRAPVRESLEWPFLGGRHLRALRALFLEVALMVAAALAAATACCGFRWRAQNAVGWWLPRCWAAAAAGVWGVQ